MSKHNDPLHLRHMLDHAAEAVELCRGWTLGDLERERLLQLGLVRLIEIVGEAAVRISKDLQNLHPEIPRPQIVAMRNRLVHGYDFVDHAILWQTVQEELPALIAQLEEVIRSSPPRPDPSPQDGS
jgi:uncharacterized protein with HEPN domain